MRAAVAKRSEATVEAAVLDGLGHVLSGDADIRGGGDQARRSGPGRSPLVAMLLERVVDPGQRAIRTGVFASETKKIVAMVRLPMKTFA